jgi:hypothetical protein
MAACSPWAFVALFLSAVIVAGTTEHFALVHKLAPEDDAPGGNFGGSVSMSLDGSLMLVGALGSAYLHEATTGALVCRLLPDDTTFSNFGISVAMSSDGARAVVGASSYSQYGSVYVYDRLTCGLVRKLTPSDGVPQHRFGEAVAANAGGTRVVVGASGDDHHGSQSGAAYVYDVATGSLLVKLTPDDGGTGDQFGFAVSMSSDGNRVAAGARYGGGGAGSVYVYDAAGGGLECKFVPDDGVSGGSFGHSVSMIPNGSLVAVGSPRDNEKGANSGSAYIYNVEGVSLVRKIVPDDGNVFDEFGVSLSMSHDGRRVIVGSMYDSDGGSLTGSAYVYDISTGALVDKVTPNDAAPDDTFGRSVSTTSNGDRVVVGAPNDDDRGSDSGSVYVYELPSPALAQAPSASPTTQSETCNVTTEVIDITPPTDFRTCEQYEDKVNWDVCKGYVAARMHAENKCPDGTGCRKADLVQQSTTSVYNVNMASCAISWLNLVLSSGTFLTVVYMWKNQSSVTPWGGSGPRNPCPCIFLVAILMQIMCFVVDAILEIYVVSTVWNSGIQETISELIEAKCCSSKGMNTLVAYAESVNKIGVLGFVIICLALCGLACDVVEVWEVYTDPPQYFVALISSGAGLAMSFMEAVVSTVDLATFTTDAYDSIVSVHDAMRNPVNGSGAIVWCFGGIEISELTVAGPCGSGGNASAAAPAAAPLGLALLLATACVRRACSG